MKKITDLFDNGVLGVVTGDLTEVTVDGSIIDNKFIDAK
jgi:hypothetical protein